MLNKHIIKEHKAQIKIIFNAFGKKDFSKLDFADSIKIENFDLDKYRKDFFTSYMNVFKTYVEKYIATVLESTYKINILENKQEFENVMLSYADELINERVLMV